MSTSESGAAPVSDEGGTAARSPDRGVSSTSLDAAAATGGSTVIVVKSVPSSEAEVTSTSSGTCTASWHLPSLDAGLEEKDPFLGMSEEDMNKLDRVLFSEEGQKVFETSVRPVGSVVANKAHQLTTELHELSAIGHNDFIIDDVILQEGLKEDLSAFADSFGDHGYCAHTGQASVSVSSVSVAKEEEREIKDSGDEKEDSDDKDTKDESPRILRRRSTRIHDNRQHQEAEQIMQENIEQEKKARRSLLGEDSPSEMAKSPTVKHYNMRAKRTPRDYPDFVTPKQRTSRGKPLDGRGDGVEEPKVEKADESPSESDSSNDSNDEGNTTGNTTGSTRSPRPAHTKSTKPRLRRACKKDDETSNNEADDETTDTTSRRKSTRNKSPASTSTGNAKAKPPPSSSSSSEDSDNDTLVEIKKRTGCLRGSNARKSSESCSDAPLSSMGGGGKIGDRLKAENGEKSPSQVTPSKTRAKVTKRLVVRVIGKIDKPKEESKSKSEEGNGKDVDGEEKVKSKKRIRKGKKKEKVGEEEVKKEGGEITPKQEDEAANSPAVEEDSDSEWGSEDDPDRLWCICRKPYANRFMICCDKCKDWFHGSCMGLTRKQGTDIVRKNHTWLCSKCNGKGETRKSRRRSVDSASESTDTKPVPTASASSSDEESKPIESTSAITVSSVDMDEPVESPTKTLAEEAIPKVKDDDPEVEDEGSAAETSDKSPEQKESIKTLYGQLQEMKRKRRHRESLEVARKDSEEVKVETMSPSEKPKVKKKSSKSAEDRRRSVEEKAAAKNKHKPSKLLRKDRCIGTECVKTSRPASVYCSDACIVKHAQESLKLIGNERKKTYGNRSHPGMDSMSGLPSSERIVVFDRKTGKIVTGPVAPTSSTLEGWLSRHASFEVLQPGSQVTQSTKSFYGTSANKQEKQEPKRHKALVKDVVYSPSAIREHSASANREHSASANREHSASANREHSAAANREHSAAPVHRKDSRDSNSSNTSREHKHSTKVPESMPRPSPSVPSRERAQNHHHRTSSGEHTRKPEVKVRRDSQSPKRPKHRPRIETIIEPHVEKNFGPDPVRISVRKTLRDLLNNRANDADDIMLSGGEIKHLALEIEDELFKYYGAVTSKYKNKYRSLVFNVKDPKNMGLFRKVMNAEIKPHALVRLTSEQLAAKELAMWREQETRHSLDMIEKSEKEERTTQVIKKTHKGDVNINDEDLSLLENKTFAVETTPEATGNILTDDTTRQHKNHLFDLNCKICTGKVAPPADDDDAPPQKRVRIGKTVVCGENKLSRLEGITIGEIRSRSQDEDDSLITSHDDDDYVEPVATSSDRIEPARNYSAMDEDYDGRTKTKSLNEFDAVSRGTSEQQSRTMQASETAAGKTENRSGLKSCLKMKSASVVSKPSLLESPAVAVSTTTVSSPDSMPSSSVEVMSNEPIIWKGSILIQEMLKCTAIAYHVSGPNDHLKEELPTVIDVRGRISPAQVWDYLSRLRHMIGTMRELTVIRFQFASTDEKSAYMQLYSYLSTRNRCGVIGNMGRVIKDMYLVPLASHDPLPAVLLPFDGPGLAVNRSHLLLGILIKQKTKRTHQAGPRNIYTVRPEFREKGAAVVAEAEQPAKRVCVADSDTAIAVAKTKTKPVKPQVPSKEASPDSDSTQISEKQRKDPIVKEYALVDPRKFANEPAPGSSPYSPPEDGYEDEPYDPEFGINSPDAMAVTAKTETAKKTAPMPPRVNIDPRVAPLVGGATTPSEITAAMLATLAGTSRLSEQRRVLQQLTEKVEEQKRAIQLQMQMKQQADILAVGGIANAQPTQATISESSYAKVEEQKRAIEQLMEMNQHATIQAVGSVAIAQPTQATIPEPGIANVEEQKRAMEQLMEMKQQAMIPVVQPTRAPISQPSHVEPMAVAVETRNVSEPNAVQSIPLPAVTSYVPPPKPKSASSLAAKAHVATVNPIVVEKPQPAFSKQAALDAQLSKPPLPAVDKKIRDPVPNAARKRLSKKIANAPVVTPPVVTKPVVPSVLTNTAFSGNLSLLPASVQLLLTSGSQQTVDSDDSQPDTESGSTTGVEVKSPDDGNKPEDEVLPSDEVHVENDVEKVEEFKAGNNPGVNDENVLKLVEKALAAIGSSGNVVAAEKTAAVPEPKKEESQPCESDVTESNPHGDVDYRIAPAGGFPPLSQLPLVPAPQLPRQPAFWAKPDESTIRSPGATAGPGSIPGFEPDEPAFTADPPQKQPGWDPFAPDTKPISEPVFPTGPVVVSQPPDDAHPREPPPRMWNPPRPPAVRPLGGVRPPVRFGSTLPRAPPPVFVAPQPPPPKTPNVAPVPSGDIDERIRAPFLPGSRGHPWQPPAVRPPIVPPPLPETAKPAVVPSINPAVVVPTMDLSALGKFAVEFLKEQKQKGQVGTQPSGTGSEVPGTGMPPPALQTAQGQSDKLPDAVPPVKAIDADERCSTDNVQLSRQVVGRIPTQQKGHDALVMPPPALQIQTVREQTHKLPGAIPPVKAIDTDERRSKDTVQLSHQVVGRIPTQQKGHDALGMPPPALQIQTVQQRTHKLPDAVPPVKAIDTDDRRSSDNVHHVAGSAEKSIDMSNQSQVTSREPPLLVQDNVTSVSLQRDGLKKGNTSLAEDDSRWDAFAKCVQKKGELSKQVKEKVIVIDEKTNLVSEKKTKAKSGVIDLTELCRVTTKNRESGVTGKVQSKWVPMGAAVTKPPNVAPMAAVKVQHVADKSSAPTTDKRSPKAAKVARVQLKPLGKSLIETKMPQLLDPVEAKPVLSSLAEIKLPQQSSNEVPVPVNIPKVKKRKDPALSDVQSKAQVPDNIQSKDESPPAKDNILVKHSPRSKKKRDAAVLERVSSKKAKAKKSVDKPRSRSSSSKSSGARHRTRSRSRERLKKERRRSRSREKRSESHRDRKRSTSKSRGRNQRATKRGSRSRSRDRDAKHARSRDGGAKRRSRDRDVKRRSRSRSRDRDVKRRSRSRSRDRDVKRRSRSRSRDREAKWKSRSDSRERRESERNRGERRLESVGRRSSPDIQNIETVSRDDRGDNDERIRYGHSRDVDQRTAEHGDRDERYMQNIPSVTGQTGGADADAQKSFEKSLLEGGRDTDERVPARTSVLTSPFVSDATEPWTGQTPPGDASGDTDDREPWCHHGDRDLFAEPQPMFDPAAPGPNVQPHNDPRTSHNDPRMPPVTFTHPPPVNQMVPPHPSAWVPRMTGPRPPFFPPPIGLPERQPFRPRGPGRGAGRGWSRGGRPGPW